MAPPRAIPCLGADRSLRILSLSGALSPETGCVLSSLRRFLHFAMASRIEPAGLAILTVRGYSLPQATPRVATFNHARTVFQSFPPTTAGQSQVSC